MSLHWTDTPDDPARVGSPDYLPFDSDDIEQVQDMLDQTNRELRDMRIELAEARLALSRHRHVLRRAMCLLSGEAARTSSSIMQSLADECRSVLGVRS